MKKSDFVKDTNVIAFVKWLAHTLPTLRIHLRVGASRFVPAPINATVIGVEAVLSKYQWKTSGMLKGDWPETKRYLKALAEALRSAVSAKNNAATLLAAENILKWGGNRNYLTGAYPFMKSMTTASGPGLWRYIQDTGGSFALARADTTTISPPVTLMNSMLTKVHALYANDGLPIYDSRVAAAIASLVECWRITNTPTGTSLPPALVFPATLPTRTVLRVFPGTVHPPGVMAYGAASTPALWSGAKIRLGWLMEAVLNQATDLFLAEGVMSDRMHAFEASLFVIGYDVACLSEVSQLPSDRKYKNKTRDLLRLHNSIVPTMNKTVRPLSGQGQDIHYSGTVENGFSCSWGDLQFVLNPSSLDEITAEFGGDIDIPLGASTTPPRPANSLGQWLENNGWPSARYASAIASILRNEGIITNHRGNKPIFLTFA